jgi:tetratricopeptide (TPR) repeat protein
MGEAHLAEKNTEEALDAFDAVIKNYPKSGSVPAAYLQKGKILEGEGKISEAIAIYDALARKYPHRKEAQTAAQRLRALRGDKEPAPKPARQTGPQTRKPETQRQRRRPLTRFL